MAFRVSTVHIAPGASKADPTAGTIELGEISRDAVLALLERLKEIDAGQIVDAEPHLVVTSRSGRFIVRTGRNKLFLYDARDSVQPYAELSPEEILGQLERPGGVTVAPWATGEEAAPLETPARRAAPHRGIAATILVAGLALNGYTLYSVFYTESVNVVPIVNVLTDPKEVAMRTRAVAGTYVTGDKSGDRTIVVQPDGQIRFSEIGSRNVVLNNNDTYRIGRLGGKLCLSTVGSGTIEIADLDTLVYYRDVYKRK